MVAVTGRRHTILVNVLLALGYAALGTLSLYAVRDTGLAAPVWPAAGVALATVLVYGWRVAPGVAIGSLLVNIPAVLSDEQGVIVALGVPLIIAGGAALQAMVGSSLVTRFVGPRPPLVDAGSIVRFLLLAGPVACVIAPTVGLGAQLAGGVVPPSRAALVWLTWWVGDSIGVVLFAPMTLMVLPLTRDTWRGRRMKIVIPSLIMLVAAVWFFLQDAAVQRADQTRAETQIALEARAQLERTLDRQLESLEGINGLFAASEYVSSMEFAAFTAAALDRADGLQALSWNERVSADEVQDYVIRMRVEDGIPDFVITERDAEGTLRPASSRPEYVVITYIEPVAGNAAALGYDIASNPVRKAAIEAAVESGEVRATAPIDLVQGTEGQKGVLILQPVFDGGQPPASLAERADALRGFAVGVYRFGDLLSAAFADPRWDDIHLSLSDVTEGQGTVLLAERATDAEEAALGPIAERMDIAGRTWQLSVQPTATADWADPPTYSVVVLVVGLVMTFLLEAFLLLLTGTERQARRQAAIHGYEANHDSLTGLYNRRAFVDQLGTARSRAEEEASRHVLLYMDLDGFKAVNDTGGHEAGDAMLQAIADSLRTHIRDRDIVARLGGDEFAAILNNCPEPRGRQIAEALVTAVEEARPEGYPDAPSVSMSVGLTMIDGAEAVSVDELLRRADRACYAAKAAGRGQVRVNGSDRADHIAG